MTKPSRRLSSLLAEAKSYAKERSSRATTAAHSYDWNVFSTWCRKMKLRPIPASTNTILAFLADQAKTKKMATITRYKSSISVIHKEKGYPSPFDHPAVAHVLEGMRRRKGMAQEGRDALDYDAVASAKLGDDITTIRDRALVLFGFMTALRGTEICALNIEDLEFTDAGVLVTVRKSKTDQHKIGRVVSVPYGTNLKNCPVRALSRWLGTIANVEKRVARPDSGPVFRQVRSWTKPIQFGERVSRSTVWSIVKDIAKRAGLEGDFGAHSLRVGYVTRARKNGVSWDAIKEQTGHKGSNDAMVRRYSRYLQDPFEASQSAAVLESKTDRRNPATPSRRKTLSQSKDTPKRRLVSKACRRSR